MYSLTLEITKRCNLNCSYCYVENKEKVNMKWKTAQLAIDIAMREAIKQKDKTLSVYFIGGEPLLAFGLLKEIIFYIEKKNEQIGLNIFYSTTTNGTVFTTEIIEFMIEKRVRFKISIDGLEDVHNENRKFVNGVGSYSEVKEKLVYKEEFEKMTGIAVHAAQLINTNTYTKFSASFRHLHELGFRYIETEINAYQKWNKEDKICLFQQIDEAFEYYISSRNRGQLWVWKFYNDMLEGFVADYLPFFPCKAIIVEIDEDCYMRAINNIVQNIFTHSKAANISITASEGNGKFRLEIGDDGIGIAKEDLNYIFERLYRCNKGRSGKGNGLGLNISKLLLEKMGGTISAFSEPGKGTVFCIEFSVIQR